METKMGSMRWGVGNDSNGHANLGELWETKWKQMETRCTNNRLYIDRCVDDTQMDATGHEWMELFGSERMKTGAIWKYY